MLKKYFNLSLLAFCFFLNGCVTQNIPLDASFWKEPHQKVAVVNYKPSMPELYQTGAEGLLDIAINSAVTNTFRKNIEKADLSSYDELNHRFTIALKHRHVLATSYKNYLTEDEDPKTNTTFAAQTDADEILTFQLRRVGGTRPYYGFIPLGAPKAMCELIGEMVDAKTRKVLWRYQSIVIEEIPGDWDQPPNYPNFNQTLTQALKNAEDNLFQNFFQE